MNESIVKYIGFYDTDLFANENRNSFLSATNKMDYIADSIVRSGKKVDIISPSWSRNEKGLYHGRKITLFDGITLTCGPTFGAKRKLFKFLRILNSWIWLFFFLLRNTEKEETIIVYHSMMILKPIILAKKIKRFKLILEVEEIYQDVKNFPSRMKKNEYIFFEYANSYIFPTHLLNDKINSDNKQYSIVHGSYKNEENNSCKYNDGNIHVVYAGTLDTTKGGAFAAVSAATHLPSNYHIHIIGFGSDKEIGYLKEMINDVSQNSKCRVTYDGIFKGEEFIGFLQSCDIGLSTQIPDGSYNDTSFPSKILSYMSNGLQVVSIRIKAVEISAIGHAVSYYEEQTSVAIANAIMSVDTNQPNNSFYLLEKLDEEFVRNIRELLRS